MNRKIRIWPIRPFRNGILHSLICINSSLLGVTLFVSATNAFSQEVALPCDKTGLRSCVDYYKDLETVVEGRLRDFTKAKDDENAGFIENFYSGKMTDVTYNADGSISKKKRVVATPVCSYVKNRFTRKSKSDACVAESDKNHNGDDCGQWAKIELSWRVTGPSAVITNAGDYGKRERAYQTGGFVHAIAHYFNQNLDQMKRLGKATLTEPECIEMGKKLEDLEAKYANVVVRTASGLGVDDVNAQLEKCHAKTDLNGDGSSMNDESTDIAERSKFQQSACFLETGRRAMELYSSRMFLCEVVTKAKKDWSNTFGDFSSIYDKLEPIKAQCEQSCGITCTTAKAQTCYETKMKAFFEEQYRPWSKGGECR